MSGSRKISFVALLVSVLPGMLAYPVSDANASTHHKHRKHHAVAFHPQPASFIVDLDRNKVIESENADALRYPASLTKMMTLYLTFEALKNGTLNLNDTIPVSAHAAGQPKTNLALTAGDRIAVKEAILSIVVRSANDAAVALGEALAGGSEEAFARKMTAKARALGMKRTVFHNASGLPDPLQHTTARDMATLGIALRKNYPQYFPFFKTESFSFRGQTYVTHNHVMMRYEGVDGIKTGYIRASGYNLVTSATRDNHHVIAVVMGGSSFRSRDDKMIALLDKSFANLSTLPGNRVQMASSGRKIPLKTMEGLDDSTEGEGDRPESENSAADAAPQAVATAEKPAAQTQTASIATGSWGIQVGAFARMQDAKAAIARVSKIIPDELANSQISASGDTNTVHRARIANLSQEKAEQACHKLTTLHEPCFVYHLD